MSGHHKWSEIKHKRRWDEEDALREQLVDYIAESRGIDESYWFMGTYRRWRWLRDGAVRP